MVGLGSLLELKVAGLNAHAAGCLPEEILALALRAFHPRIAFACSMGLEDVVLVDMVSRSEPRPRIFFLDTGRLHQETYDTLAALRARLKSVTSRLNIQTLEMERALRVAMNDIVEVALELQAPIAVDCFAAQGAKGAVILMDEASNETVAGGLILAYGASQNGSVR